MWRDEVPADPLDGALPAQAGCLPPQAAGEVLLRQKYLLPGERGREDLQRRVAHAISLAEAEAGSEAARGWQQRFEQALQDGFLPGGRILAAAGAGAHRCWMSCFVQPLGGPRATPGLPAPSLEEALAQTRATLRMGGGVGLDFSARDDVPQALQAFDAACDEATRGTGRPGALMAVLRADHPQWAAFMGARHALVLAHFNRSIALDDAFMHRVLAGEADAARRWQALVQAAWSTGEPGVLFLDAMQRDDSLGWRETLVATNPCGEQPLPPHGSCCLGSLDLTRFVSAPFRPNAHMDLAKLARTATVAVRMLDNAITLTPWPLAEQQAEAMATRRIGLGFTGLGDALAMLGLRYDEPGGRAAAARIMRALRDAAVRASAALSVERGPYPLFNAQRHLAAPGFASRWPAALQALVRRQGLRHSHLLSVAPTGSISLALADNVSSGVEPVWAWHLERSAHGPAGRTLHLRLDDHAWRLWRHGTPDLRSQAPLPQAFVTAREITSADQVAMVAAVAPYVDGGISKTVHLGRASTPGTVDQVFRQAWNSGLKGITVFRADADTRPLLRPARCRC